MEGCFIFQWEGLFFRWGASFLSGGGGVHRMGGIGFGGQVFKKKNCKIGGCPPMPPSPLLESLVLNIIPFDQQYLSNLLLNELTDGYSTTYPGKLFHKLVTRTIKKLLLMLALHVVS